MILLYCTITRGAPDSQLSSIEPFERFEQFEPFQMGIVERVNSYSTQYFANLSKFPF